jgi:DNA-binding transcriptional LysR family regulator
MVTFSMQQTNINTVDLNLLRVFDALMEEGSVTRAGARLGLSQSAVSHSLNRLRVVMDDELFVRSPRGMRPTARATELAARIHAALTQLQGALAPRVFDPTTTERPFTLMAGPYAAAVLLPTLVSRMATEAPRARLVVVETSSDLLDEFDSHRVDFAIGGVESGPERLQVEQLLPERLVWVVRTGHPLTKGRVTLERLIQTPHVAIRRPPQTVTAGRSVRVVMRSSWEDQGALESELATRGLERRIGVTVPDTYSALAIVRRSDMAALIPQRLAALSAQSGFLAMLRPPYPSPEVTVNLICLRERLADPAMAWMHGLIIGVAAQA